MDEKSICEGPQHINPRRLSAGELVNRHMIGIKARKLVRGAGLNPSNGECLPGDRRDGVKCAGGGVGGYSVSNENPARVYVRGTSAGPHTWIFLGNVEAHFQDLR